MRGRLICANDLTTIINTLTLTPDPSIANTTIPAPLSPLFPHPSDNISALALLHDSLMRSAASDGVRLKSGFSVHPQSVSHAARLLWPELELQRGRARRLKLLQALQVGGVWGVFAFCFLSVCCILEGESVASAGQPTPNDHQPPPPQELRVQDGDISYLAPEYKQMLNDQAASSSNSGGAAGSSINGGSGGGALGGARGGVSGGGRALAGAGGDSGKGGGRAGGGDANAQLELAAAEESMRQMFRDYCRLGGGGGGGAGGIMARLPGLDALLSKAGEEGARLVDVVAYMQGEA